MYPRVRMRPRVRPRAWKSPRVQVCPRVRKTPRVRVVWLRVCRRACFPALPCVEGAPQLGGTTCAREAAHVCEPPCVVETPRVSAPVGVSDGVCVGEAPGVSDRPCVRVTACVRSQYTREMAVGMHEHVAASPVVSMNGNVKCSLSLVARGSVSARREWRRRLRLWRAKGRVAAVVALGTVPGLHGSARMVRAVPRTRPPRARLRR